MSILKRKFNIFLHNIRVILRNKRLRYRVRFFTFACAFLIILFMGVFALFKSYAFYNSKNDLILDIQTAMYVIDEGEMTFNIDLEKIIPSDETYVYAFSVSNYNETSESDVDLEYELSMETTTNMPLSYKLYYGTYNKDNADIIVSRELKQDEDDCWYNVFEVAGKREFTYKEKRTDNYYLVIDFPLAYKYNLEYSDAMENIQVIIKSKQIL